MKKIFSSLALIVLIIACKKTETISLNQEEVASASAQKQGGNSSPSVTTTAVHVSSAFAEIVYGNVGNGNGNTV